MRLSIAIISAAFLLTTAVVAARQNDVYRQFGTNAAEANDNILTSFTTGIVSLAGERSVFKTASPETRATLVRGVIAAARAYTGTQDFAQRYTEFRADQKPHPGHDSPEGFKEELAEWEKQYPADPKVLVVRRLREFLALSATVNFTARLEQRPDKQMRFADPELEEKPAEWKLLFRAGKPAVDAARAAAGEWLKAIGG